jgi:uncharacterized protein DUF547
MNPMQRHITNIIMVFIIFASFTVMPAAAKTGAVDHSLFGELLGKYVHDGVVNYKGFQTEEKKLDHYLSALTHTDTSQLTRSEKFAFYVNAYNAWTIKLILSGYPKIESIWDLGGRIFDKPFQKEFIKIDKKTVSLDYIEHTILRPTFKDSRVHFAVNCASKSCPPLLSKPYLGKTLDSQLDGATRAFINDPGKNHIKGDTLYVSKIFKWFSGDFDNDAASFILKYASEDLKSKINSQESLKVKYLDYDWSLNGN